MTDKTDEQHSRAGKAGAASLLARYGADHMREIGRRGGQVTRDRYGAEHLRAAGRKGGAASRGKPRKARTKKGEQAA